MRSAILGLMILRVACVSGHDIAKEFPPMPCKKMCSFIEGKRTPFSYHCECHDITSTDGFVMQTARLVNDVNASKGVAFLMHGFLTTGMDWVVQPDSSSNLAFMLLDAGFDVWLGNSRGNVFSLANSKMDINTEEFWDAVDVDHMAEEDVPTIVDYVLETTKAPRLHWVGHSQGGGQLVLALARNPSLADRLGSSVLLAPGVHMTHVHVPLLKYMAVSHFDQVWRNVGFDIPGIATNLDYFPGPGVRTFLEFFTGKTPLCQVSVAFCNDIGKLMGVNVGDPKNLDYRTMADAYKFDPGCSSFHLVMQWAQRMRKESLHKFDWGKKKNMQVYNSKTPPLYDLSKIKGAHLALFDGDKDLFIQPPDMKSLYAEVPKENWIEHTTMHNYAHFDFLWGKDARVRLYPEIIKVLSSEVAGVHSTVMV